MILIEDSITDDLYQKCVKELNEKLSENCWRSSSLNWGSDVKQGVDGCCIITPISDVINPLTYNLTCYTGDKFRTPSQYEDVVDMEAYAIAKVCYLHNVDFISYKYITDDGSADDWVSNCHMGTKQFKEVLKDYEE